MSSMAGTDVAPEPVVQQTPWRGTLVVFGLLTLGAIASAVVLMLVVLLMTVIARV